jgi:hypothetical protein
MSNLNFTKTTAINAIVDHRTCTIPCASLKLKADKALLFIDNFSKKEQKEIHSEIERKESFYFEQDCEPNEVFEMVM